MKAAEIEEIARELHYGKLILFVGSGMSAGLSKECYPTWGELINKLIDKHLQDDSGAQAEARQLLAKDQYLDAAWVIDRVAGGLRAKLADEFKKKDCPEVAARYELLRDLPFKAFFTTNYDCFLDNLGKSPVTQEDVKSGVIGADKVFHLHGHQSRSDTMVLTSMDFTRLKFERSPESVMQVAASHSFLFLGYSMDDEDVRLWLERSCLFLNQTEGQHWALVDGAKWGKYRRELYKQRFGVRMVDAELKANWKGHQYPDISAFLKQLRAAWKKLVREPRSEKWTADEKKLYIDPLVKGKNQPEISLDQFFRLWLKDDSRRLLVVLGQFGVGKTWFSFQAADLVREAGRRTPVVVPLRQFNSGADPDVIAGWAAPCEEKAFLDANGRGEYVLFLDAFDEMGRPPKTTLEACFQRLSELAESTKAKVVVTCRREFFRDEDDEKKALRPDDEIVPTEKVEAKGVERVEVQLFDPTRIKLAFQARGRDDLFEQIEKQPRLLMLASRPVVHDLFVEYGQRITSATKRVQLYEDHVLRLLTRGKGEGYTARREFAERVAVAIQSQKSRAGSLPVLEVEKLAEGLVSSDEELNDFRGRSLLVRQGNEFAFGHASFREYLVAKQILGDLREGRMPVCTRLSNPTIEFLREMGLHTPQSVKAGADGMVVVPAGPFIFGEGDTARVENMEREFQIDKYPVTNEQYLAFLVGAKKKREDNWIYHEQSQIGESLKLKDEKFSQHPVTGVTWHGAMAYAKAMKTELPTEFQWEKAARGFDGRVFPWGDESDKAKCNAEESGRKGTTAVTEYEKAGNVSPYGCVDMAGNVWEWTASEFSSGSERKTLRGGSFYNEAAVSRCAIRNDDHPDDWNDDTGFRCART